MKIAKLVALAGLGLVALSASAEARTWSGYTVAKVNERAGPSTAYPSVAVIPAGAPIVIYGCLDDVTWCDISWGPNRGWMAATYLQVTYQSRRVPLHDYITPLGIPFLTFSFDTYWGDHYRRRPFFHQEDQWRHTNADHNQLPPPLPAGSLNGNNPQNNNPPVGNTFHKPTKTFDTNGQQQGGSTGVGKPPKIMNNDNGGQNQNSGSGNPPNGAKPGDNTVNPPQGGNLKPGCVMQDGKVVCQPN